MRCRLGNGMPFDQNVFAAKFPLWIAAIRCVAVRLNTVVKLERLGIGTERIVDLFFSPNVERSLGGLGMVGVTDPGYNGAVRVLGGKESAFFGGHIARDVIEDI